MMNKSLIALCGLSMACSRESQQPVATTAADSPAPTAGQVALPTTATDVSGAHYRRRHARRVRAGRGPVRVHLGWPMVNMLNRRDAVTQAPEPGRLNGVLPVAPRGQVAMLADYIDAGQNFVTCPNQDVVYGLGFFALDEEPVVVQVPDFAGG